MSVHAVTNLLEAQWLASYQVSLTAFKAVSSVTSVILHITIQSYFFPILDIVSFWIFPWVKSLTQP